MNQPKHAVQLQIDSALANKILLTADRGQSLTFRLEATGGVSRSQLHDAVCTESVALRTPRIVSRAQKLTRLHLIFRHIYAIAPKFASDNADVDLLCRS